MIDSAIHSKSALRYIKSFEQKYGEESLQLACHAALPVVINADLVHLLRINFFLDQPKSLTYTSEADLLLSSLCHDIGDGLYEIAPNIRNVLLQRMVREHSQERIHDLATLLWQYNERYAPWTDRPELERAQQLTALNFLDPLKAKQWLAEAEISMGSASFVEREWFVAMRREINSLEDNLELSEPIIEIAKTVGAKIREARLAKKLTQSQLADPDFSVSYISAIEQGEIYPSLRSLEIIAQRLGLSSGDLLSSHVQFSYESGLRHLLDLMDKNHAKYSDMLILQARLLKNLRREQQYGQNEDIRTERIHIVEQLNNLALQTIGISFNDLCQLEIPTTSQLNLLEESQPDTSEEYYFGKLLRQFRMRQGLSQQALAEKLGFNRNTIANWEQGNRRPKTRSIVLELARVLQLSDKDTSQLLNLHLGEGVRRGVSTQQTSQRMYLPPYVSHVPMENLVVLTFPTAEGAQIMLGRLEALQKQQLITVVDGAIVSWPAGASKPKTEQLRNLTGVGALGGAFWGMLFGLLFFIPFFGLAVGAAIGALAGHFANYGIDDDFINSVRSKITPGTSALFLLTSGAVLDKVAEGVKDIQYEIIQINLSKEQKAALKEAFGQE